MNIYIIGGALLFALIIIGIVIYFVLTSTTKNTPSDTPPKTCVKTNNLCSASDTCCTSTDTCLDGTCTDCLSYITNVCKPNGGAMSCEEYAECIERSDIAAFKNISGCTNWFSGNCSDFKPSSGPGVKTNNTLTWSGYYYKINAFFGGTVAAIPNFDNTITTLVLVIDFSSSVIHNDTGSFIAFGLANIKVTDLQAKYSKITATATSSNSDDPINIIAFSDSIPGIPAGTIPGTNTMVKSGIKGVSDSFFSDGSNVYVYDSTVSGIATEMMINTDTDLTDKKVTFTITFTS